MINKIMDKLGRLPLILKIVIILALALLVRYYVLHTDNEKAMITVILVSLVIGYCLIHILFLRDDSSLRPHDYVQLTTKMAKSCSKNADDGDENVREFINIMLGDLRLNNPYAIAFINDPMTIYNLRIAAIAANTAKSVSTQTKRDLFEFLKSIDVPLFDDRIIDYDATKPRKINEENEDEKIAELQRQTKAINYEIELLELNAAQTKYLYDNYPTDGNPSVNSHRYNTQNQASNDFMQQEMMRQHNEFAMDEARKSVTPFDMGGYVQGDGFNPSDTMAADAMRQNDFDNMNNMNDMGGMGMF